MILSAIDREKYEEMMQEEGKNMGLEKGRKEGLKEGRLKLINQVCKKLRKGKSCEEIADEFEEEVETISIMCSKAAELAPDYDSDKLYRLLYGQG